MVARVGFAVVAEQPVIATQAEERIATHAAIDPVAAARTHQDVVAGAAVDHRHPIVAPGREIRHVNRARPLDEPEPVVAAKAGDLELLDEWRAPGVAPR